MTAAQGKMVDDILRILAIPSVTSDSEGIVRCQLEYRKIAERMGFKTYSRADGRVIVVEPEGMEKIPEIGIVVHLDTVPYVEGEWNHNPLGEIADDRIYGRGIIDDKGAAIMALYAVKELKGPAAKKWQIIAGSSEEGEWIDMDLYMKENPALPRFLFTIDGDGVQHGCRGYLDMELRFKRSPDIGTQMLQRISVENPTNNIVPAKALAVIAGRRVTQEGIAVHSSIPETGVNALSKLASRLRTDYYAAREFPKFFELMDRIENASVSESIGFLPEKTECTEGCETSVVPVNCEIKGDELFLTLNVRLCVHTTSSMIANMVSYIGREYNCNCYVKSIKLPAYVERDSVYIQKMLDSYQEVLGKETSPCIARGTGYNAALPNCVIFGPRFDVAHDEEDYCHAVDESRKISDLLAFMDILVLYLKKVLMT